MQVSIFYLFAWLVFIIVRSSPVSSLFETLLSLLLIIIGAVLFTTSKVSSFSIVFSVLMSGFDFKFELKID